MAQRAKIKRTTIIDIARASGVSVSTVSRILNNKPDVAEETRQRVLQVIEEQKFAPQIVWQQLRSGRSRTLTLHFPQDFNPPAQDIITGAALRCASEGYSLNLIANSLTETDLLTLYRSGQADGVILMEILTHDWRVELLRRHGYPFVMIGRCEDNTGLSYVDLDIGQGVTDAVQHLVALGHRRIGFVIFAPVLQQKEYGYVTWALQAYRKACQEFDLPVLWRAVDLKSNHVHEAVLGFLGQVSEITALITPQNAGVPGILKAVQMRGWRIPDDFSVIGLVDDAMSDFLAFPLTAIRFPSRQLGDEAARILIAQLEGRLRTAQHVLLPAELHVRGSTGPVAHPRYI